MYQLAYPWLLALLPLPLLVWWLVPPHREETASVRLAFFDEITRAAGLTPAAGAVVPRTNRLQKIVAPVCWALIVLALACPQFVEPSIEKVLPARDLLLSLDLSQSMDTRDFADPSGRVVARVDGVRNVVDDFVTRRSGDRIGLISERVLIVLTDGNDTASRMPPKRAGDIAKERGIKIHAVGIGDPNATGEDKLDIALLKDIASATGGRYFFGQDEQQLQEIYATLDNITPANHETLSWRPKRELFHWPLGIGIGLLLVYQLVMLAFAALRPSPRVMDETPETPQ
jgi:Ca-activated chloride channel family protein